MKNLVAKVRSLKLFEPGETVVVAVSGGADSVALLDVLIHLDEERLNLVVAHLNHGLRGGESDGDEAFVAELAACHGIPLAARRVDVSSLALKERLSLEEAGRKARYAFFNGIATKYGASSIALAHHRDDQAETVLIRLLRGSGGDGLSGMAPTNGMLKRPFLQVSRDDIERYLKFRGLNYRTDSSNADMTFLRNSIRHELIPFLQRYNPKVSQRLAATAEILANDEELLDQVTAATFKRLALNTGGAVEFNVRDLLVEPRGLRLRLFRHALQQVRGDLMRIGTVHLEAIDALAASPRPNARLNLPGGLLVHRCYDTVRVAPAEDAAPANWELVVPGEGRHSLPGGASLLVEKVPRPAALETGSSWVAYLSPEDAPFPWLLRNFSPGDRFVPLGMAGTQKVKELFINAKVPPSLRRRIPLLVSGGDIVWVPGVRVGEKAAVKAGTAVVLRVEIPEITP